MPKFTNLLINTKLIPFFFLLLFKIVLNNHIVLSFLLITDQNIIYIPHFSLWSCHFYSTDIKSVYSANFPSTYKYKMCTSSRNIHNRKSSILQHLPSSKRRCKIHMPYKQKCSLAQDRVLHVYFPSLTH